MCLFYLFFLLLLMNMFSLQYITSSPPTPLPIYLSSFLSNLPKEIQQKLIETHPAECKKTLSKLKKKSSSLEEERILHTFLQLKVLLNLHLNYEINKDTQRRGEIHERKFEKNLLLSSGLLNLKNTCYLNSILQILKHLRDYSEPLIRYQMKDKEIGEDIKNLFYYEYNKRASSFSLPSLTSPTTNLTNFSNPRPSFSSFFSSLSSSFSSTLSSSSSTTTDPTLLPLSSLLRNIINKLNLDINHQEDSQEVFLNLLNSIDESLIQQNKKLKKLEKKNEFENEDEYDKRLTLPSSPFLLEIIEEFNTFDITKEKQEDLDEEEEEKEGEGKHANFYKNVRLYSNTADRQKILSIITRKKHLKTVKKKNYFFDLSLPLSSSIPSSTTTSLASPPPFSLSSSLQSFFSSELIENGDKPIVKNIYISQLPQILALHLKRFTYDPFVDNMTKV